MYTSTYLKKNKNKITKPVFIANPIHRFSCQLFVPLRLLKIISSTLLQLFLKKGNIFVYFSDITYSHLSLFGKCMHILANYQMVKLQLQALLCGCSADSSFNLHLPLIRQNYIQNDFYSIKRHLRFVYMRSKCTLLPKFLRYQILSFIVALFFNLGLRYYQLSLAHCSRPIC